MFIWFYHSLYIYKFAFCYKVKPLLLHLSISLYYLFMDSYFIQWFILHYVQCLVTQSCLTLCDPKDCSPPGSSVHGIIQARILERVAMSSSRGSSQPRDQTQVSHIAGRFVTIWATREALYHINNIIYLDAQIVQEFISSWLLCLFKTLNSHENISNSSASAPDLLQLLSLTPFSSSEKPDLHYPQYMFWFWYAWSPC